MKNFLALLIACCLLLTLAVSAAAETLSPTFYEGVLDGTHTFDHMESITESLRILKSAVIAVNDPKGTFDVGSDVCLAIEGNFSANVDTVDLTDGSLVIENGGVCILNAETLLFGENGFPTVEQGGYFELCVENGIGSFVRYVTEHNIPCRITLDPESGLKTYAIGQKPCSHEHTDTATVTATVCMECGAVLSTGRPYYASTFSGGSGWIVVGIASLFVGALAGILGTKAYLKRKP